MLIIFLNNSIISFNFLSLFSINNHSFRLKM
nr:MAG TPA: hypothetical protein [Caudoviricetes sp.]